VDDDNGLIDVQQPTAQAGHAGAAASAAPQPPPLSQAEELAEEADGLPVDGQLLDALREAVAAGQAWEAAAKQCVLASEPLKFGPLTTVPICSCAPTCSLLPRSDADWTVPG
jgi:hypothetical protein